MMWKGSPKYLLILKKLDIMIEIYIKMLIWIIIGWKDLIVDMKKIIGIKVEKIIALVKKVEIIFIIIIPNNDISNNIGFNEFEKTIQKMQEHLQQKNSNNENNYNSQKNEIILNKEINMKNKNCNFVNNNNNSNIIKKNEINLNKKQSKKRRRKIIRWFKKRY